MGILGWKVEEEVFWSNRSFVADCGRAVAGIEIGGVVDGGTVTSVIVVGDVVLERGSPPSSTLLEIRS